MKRRTILLGLVVALVGLALVPCSWVGCRYIVAPVFHQATECPRVKSCFGFDYDTPYVGDSHCSKEVLSIPYVRPGGPFDLAGIRDGDIVTPGSHGGIAELCIQLDQLEPGDSMELLVRTPEKVGCWIDWPERAAFVVAP